MITSPKTFTIYVGMALSDAPDEFRIDFQDDLKSQLRTLAGVTVLDFVGLEGGSNTDVSRHDKKCVQEADLAIFILDYPSTGMGKEIVYRENTGKPDLYFAKQGKRVTRMVLGELEDANKPLHRYSRVRDIVEIVWAYILNEQPDITAAIMDLR